MHKVLMWPEGERRPRIGFIETLSERNHGVVESEAEHATLPRAVNGDIAVPTVSVAGAIPSETHDAMKPRCEPQHKSELVFELIAVERPEHFPEANFVPHVAQDSVIEMLCS